MTDKITKDDFMKVMNTLAESKTTKIETKQEFVMPAFLKPREVRKLLDEKSQTFAVIRELTTLDFITVKNILKEHNIEDDTTLDLFLIAQSWKGMEYVAHGETIVIDMPKVEKFEDYYARMNINTHYFSVLQAGCDELNGNNEGTLGK